MPKDSWEEIRNGWKKPQKENELSWWKVAAVIFIISSAALLGHNLLLRQEIQTLATLGDISSKYEKVEQDYLKTINDIESNINIREVRSDENLKWLFEELDILDQVNEMYRKDIGNVDEQLIVGTIIDHYEKKIRLLKKLELEIKRNQKFKENEKDIIDSVNM